MAGDKDLSKSLIHVGCKLLCRKRALGKTGGRLPSQQASGGPEASSLSDAGEGMSCPGAREDRQGIPPPSVPKDSIDSSYWEDSAGWQEEDRRIMPGTG